MNALAATGFTEGVSLSEQGAALSDELATFASLPPSEGDGCERMAYDANADVLLPRNHGAIVACITAKSRDRKYRQELLLSEEATRPFSRLNRARTATALMMRELKRQQEARMARSVPLGERGIDDKLMREMRSLNVLHQTRHPCLQSVPLLSRCASRAGAAQVRDRREIAFLVETFCYLDDDDHRVAAVNLQSTELDDLWAALLGSTLQHNRTVRVVNLNGNAIGDAGVELLARALCSNASVEVLSLGGNHLTDEAARSIARLLRSGKSSLRSLNLAGMTPKAASLLSEAPEPQSEAYIRAPGAAALALALQDPVSHTGERLRALNLSFQRVWDAGAMALVAALQGHACHLEVIGLSSAQLTDRAALAFARALADGRHMDGASPGRCEHHEWQTPVADTTDQERKWPCSLRRLDLSANYITDDGARTDVVTEEQGPLFLGVDLTHNSIGSAGVTALAEAIALNPEIVFLGLRGNDTGSASSFSGRGTNPGLEAALAIVESTCAARRQRLGSAVGRKRCRGVDSTSKGFQRCCKACESIGQAIDTLGEGGEDARSSREGGTADGHERKRSTSLTPLDGFTHALGENAGGAGDKPCGKGRMASPKLAEKGGEAEVTAGNLAVVHPRPLKGKLPLRGYYISPLLDSCFDLLMLREPAPDLEDQSYYVNQARRQLDQRRSFVDPPTVRGNASLAASEYEVERGYTPIPKGTIVSPMAIHSEQERVLLQRRRLYKCDSDYAAKKSARLAGRDGPKVPRTKLLTQRHKNAAFTKYLTSGSNDASVVAKCPRGLRSHFLGLQNFEYDWGGVK